MNSLRDILHFMSEKFSQFYFKEYLIKRSFIVMFWKVTRDVSYKNMQWKKWGFSF